MKKITNCMPSLCC